MPKSIDDPTLRELERQLLWIAKMVDSYLQGRQSFSPLAQVLTRHTAPELEFLQAKWAAHLSFGAVADLLHDVLPIDTHLHGETVREHVFATAERLEAEIGPEQAHFDDFSQGEIEASADPGAPVTVGLDGGYVRGRDKNAPGANGCFEIIAGKSITPRDAHLLLQIHANVLNSDLAGAFQRWHPGFGVAPEAKLAA
jgi:hypothetical protein